VSEEQEWFTEYVSDGHESYSEVNITVTITILLPCQVIVINCVLFHTMRAQS
jgi:hypothetical protein